MFQLRLCFIDTFLYDNHSTEEYYFTMFGYNLFTHLQFYNIKLNSGSTFQNVSVLLLAWYTKNWSLACRLKKSLSFLFLLFLRAKWDRIQTKSMVKVSFLDSICSWALEASVCFVYFCAMTVAGLVNWCHLGGCYTYWFHPPLTFRKA